MMVHGVLQQTINLITGMLVMIQEELGEEVHNLMIFNNLLKREGEVVEDPGLALNVVKKVICQENVHRVEAVQVLEEDLELVLNVVKKVICLVNVPREEEVVAQELASNAAKKVIYQEIVHKEVEVVEVEVQEHVLNVEKRVIYREIAHRVEEVVARELASNVEKRAIWQGNVLILNQIEVVSVIVDVAEDEVVEVEVALVKTMFLIMIKSMIQILHLLVDGHQMVLQLKHGVVQALMQMLGIMLRPHRISKHLHGMHQLHLVLSKNRMMLGELLQMKKLLKNLNGMPLLCKVSQ